MRRSPARLVPWSYSHQLRLVGLSPNHATTPCHIPLMLLGSPAAPTLETPRLILRGWRPGDVAPYAAMLSDPETARFITRQGRPYSEAETWREVALIIGHW